MQITEIYVTTTGLYAWGKGFITQKQAEGWDTFWRNHTGNFWHSYLDSDGSVFLSTIYGGGMVHPMDFKLVLRHDDVKSRSELSELDTILHNLAQTLGFTYRFQIRGHVVPDGQTDWRTFSTADGVENSVPGRVGVPKDEPRPGRSRKAEKPEPLTCGKGPYRAEIVPSKGGSALWASPRTYASEKKAQQAILRKAKILKHVLSGYTRHWVTDKQEHIIDYGSHSLYGRITSVDDKIREAEKEETK